MARDDVRVGPYNYRAGPNSLGIGVDNMAFASYAIATDMPNYGPRYNVRKSFSPLTGGEQFPLSRFGPTNSLRANGVYMSGDLALQMLTQFNKDNNLS